MKSTEPEPPGGVRVALSAVTKDFDGRRVLGPLDLTIRAGELVAILGPSGCGKTTMLRIIAGLESPTDGKLELGPFLTGARGIAYVFQEAHLLPWRDALDNVALPLELRRVPREHARQSALAALGKVGLAESALLRPHQLSGGMRMRVSLARALVTRPSIILLDEPFAALDEVTRHRLDEDLRALWAVRRHGPAWRPVRRR